MKIEDIKERLWVEIMEDYLITAEFGHLARDQKAHKTEMREKLHKLSELVCSMLNESYDKGLIDGMEGKVFHEITIHESTQITPELMKYLEGEFEKKKNKSV
jgi:hypothetical protein